MRALVTGCAGFIGSRLCARLLTDGWTVLGIDSFDDNCDRSMTAGNLLSLRSDRFAFIRDDLNHADLGRVLVDRPDVIFHLAAIPGVRTSWGSTFPDYVTSNVLATQRLLHAMTSIADPPRLVNASSSSVYGLATSYPTFESMLPQPHSPYGVTKLAAEHLVSAYASNYDFNAVSLRFFTVYGPRQRPDMAVARFLSAARDDRALVVYGTGEQLRDFTFVDDVVESLLLAGCATAPVPPVMNISGRTNISVNDVIEIIRVTTQKDVLVHFVDAVVGDVPRTGGDSSLASEFLGWHPSVDIAEGIARQWRAMERR